MKRRDFLATSAGIAGSLLPGLGRGQSQPLPCPQPEVTATTTASTRTATTTCAASTGNAPAWFTNMSDRTWSSPVGNWIGANGVKDPLADGANSGAEGQEGVIQDYAGMLTDQGRKMIAFLANGGHNGYYGNEVYSCDLSSASPLWIRRRDSSRASGGTDVAVYSDGRPASDHSGFQDVYCVDQAGNGRWVKAGLGGTVYVGNAHYNQWFEYTVGGTEDWINRGSNFASRAGTVIGATAFDPVDRQIISVLSGAIAPSIQYVNISDFRVAAVNNNPLEMGGGISVALDTTNRILLLKNGQANNQYWWLKLSNKTGPWQQLNATGTDMPEAWGFQWHPASNAFLTWNGTTGLRKLTPAVNASGNYTSLTWTTVAGAGGVTPQYRSGLLMYGKVALIQDMGNGQSAMVVVPRYGNPDVYVFKIPAAGV